MKKLEYAWGEWEKHVFQHRETEFIEDPETWDWLDEAASRAEEIADRQETYQEFLASNYWMRVRAQVIERCRNRCELCGVLTSRLEVHHLKYPQRGTEHINLHLLQALCSSCHSQSHL